MVAAADDFHDEAADADVALPGLCDHAVADPIGDVGDADLAGVAHVRECSEAT
jgi:hypothetical protein